MVEDIKNPEKKFLNFDDSKYPPYIGDDGFLYVWSTEKDKYICTQKESLKDKADLVDGKIPVDQLPIGIGISLEVVDQLPEIGNSTKIYLVPKTESEEGNIYRRG